MKWIVVALLTITPAFAHVEPGTYKGLTSDGKECSMTAGEQYFEKNTPHPLNERIPVIVGEDSFVVGHPPIVDSKESIAFFNHDLFQGILPTSTGAKAIEIEMVHSEEFEGPKSFTVITNAWRAKLRESYKCNDIKLTK